MTVHTAPDASVRLYAAALGLSFPLVRAWANAEGQDDANYSPTNILNIQRGNTPGQVGAHDVTAAYASVADGARWTAWLVNRGPYAGIRAARAAHASDFAIARAIEQSPWAAGHYGGAGDSPGSIARQLHNPPPDPMPVKFTIVAGPATATVRAGAELLFPDCRTHYGQVGAAPTRFPLVGASQSFVLITDGGIYAAVGRSSLV